MADREEQGREALAAAIWNARNPNGWQWENLTTGEKVQSEARRTADLILKSDWLKAHDAEVAAATLREAAYDAWEQGWAAGCADAKGQTHGLHANPYRSAKRKANSGTHVGPECSTCDGSGFVHLSDGSAAPRPRPDVEPIDFVHPCPNCLGLPYRADESNPR